MAKKTTKTTKTAKPKDAAPLQTARDGYSDKLCPVHGTNKLKLRGRIFEGIVIRKFHRRVTISFDRMLKVPKYERYEKRRTKIHARLPEHLQNDVNIGDLIQIAETRPVSKTIHFVVTKVVRKKEQ